MVFRFNGDVVERLGEPVVLPSTRQRVKRYRLERRLGQGGMGIVYQAWDEKEQRKVAIKSIKLDEMDEDGEMLRRFKNEARNIARLNHPNIVHIYSEDGLDLEQVNRIVMPYMVMEYAEGGDLQERLKALGPNRLYPLKRTLHLFEQLCHAIEHMHQQNIIHRDLKPSNVLFKSPDKESDEVMLGDFGLSIREDASLISFPTAGTPTYQAPEQVFGAARKESDIFSLAVLLYQLCTGQLPFNPYDVRVYPPPASSSVNSALPTALDAVLLKALNERPARRFTSTNEFLAEVRAAMTDVLLPSVSSAPLSDVSFISKTYPAFEKPLPARPFPTESDMIQQHSSPANAIRPSLTAAVAAEEANLEMQVHNNMHNAPSLPFVPNITPSQPNINGQIGTNPSPGVIVLPAAESGKQTIKFPMAVPPGPSEAVAPVPVPSGSNKVPPHNTGKMAALGAGVAAGAAGTAMTNRGGGAGVGTSPRTNANRSNPPNNRPKRRRRGGLLALLTSLLLLALLLTCVGFAFLQPTTFASVVHSIVPSLSGVPMLTIVPDSQIASHSYVISAVTGMPDPNQRQVKAYPLSYATPPKSATVNTTGVKNIDAKSATGQVTFTSGLSTPYTFGTTTAISSASSVNFFLVQPVIIPAGNIGVSFGTAIGTARAGTPGTVGNIPAGNINTVNNSIRITNPAPFTGGQDGQHYHYVTQSDITNAAQPLETTLMQEAQSKLKAQTSAGQALASGTQCTSNVSSDHPVGDTGVDVSKVTVTVSETCTAETYDAAGLQSLVKTLLDQQVAQDPNLGKGYVLQGQVVTDTTIESIKNGTVFLNVNAKGLYAYAALDKTQLANLIKGKPADQALALLKSQPHVKDASLPSGITTLPTDVSQITIVIQMPQGFSGGGTTTGGNPTSTSVTGNG